jgi:RNA polymerase sigma factor (sigma-70 family)
MPLEQRTVCRRRLLFGSAICIASDHPPWFMISLMAGPADDSDVELELVAHCLQGDGEALGRLRETCHSSLMNILLSRGASPTEAEDLLADLWSDCVPGGEQKPSLLEKFGGRCKLLGWLSTVSTRRWIDFKRRQSRSVVLEGPDANKESPVGEMTLPAMPGEDALSKILRHSLQSAFARCSAEMLVLLRLRYVHNLSQRELAQMLGWHESKISRLLSESMQDIESDTLAEVRKQDPLLQLTWNDFINLCDTLETGLM